MGTSFIPLCAIIAVLIIAFLFASLPQVSHKMRYRVLYAIAIIMLFAVIPISECMAKNTKNSNSNYLLVRGSIQNVAWTKCRTKYVKPLVHR